MIVQFEAVQLLELSYLYYRGAEMKQTTLFGTMASGYIASLDCDIKSGEWNQRIMS